MNADSAFQIGASHSVCQDYELSRKSLREATNAEMTERGARPYIILSDGCSSSPDTDIGARLLAKAAELVLRDPGSYGQGVAEIHTEAARRALDWAELLGLRPETVDATLITAHVDGGELIVGCSGDGVVCLQTWGGVLEVSSISYASGYPLYPGYAHQPERLLALDRDGLPQKELRYYHSASAEECLQLTSTSYSDSPTQALSGRAANYKYAVVFSDGIHSFVRQNQTGPPASDEAVPMCEALRELISFKNTRGAFVGRRMNRFLKDCRRKGWQHADDLAVGALYLGD